MLIYWNKRNPLHEKRVQLPEDFVGTPTGCRFIVLEHQYGRRDVTWKRSIHPFQLGLLNDGWSMFHSLQCTMVKKITSILRGWHLLLWSILPSGLLYFTSPTEDGTAILRGHHPSNAKVSPLALQREWLHFSIILRPWVLVRHRELNPRPSALQSSALPTELILPQ